MSKLYDSNTGQMNPAHMVAGAARVSAYSEEINLTCSLDTNIYADGDVLFDTQELANAVRVPGGFAWLANIVVNDEDDQGIAFDLIFLNASTSLGTENSAPNISGANARNIVGRVQVAATDFYDLGGMRVANPAFTPRLMKAASASTSLYVAGISRGAGTYSASGIRIKFAFRQD